MRHILGIFVGITLFFVLPQFLASAQEVTNGAPAQTDTSPEKIQKIISGLSDAERSALTRLLEVITSDNAGTLETTDNQTPIIDEVKTAWQSYKTYLLKNLAGITAALAGVVQSLVAIFAGRSFAGNLAFLGFLFAAIAIGAAAEFVVTRLVRTWRELSRKAGAGNLVGMLKTVGLRLSLELIGLVVFSIATLSSVRIFFREPNDAFQASTFILLVIVMPRLMATFLRLMLAPGEPALRLVSTGEWTARFVYRNFVGVALIVGLGLYILGVMNHFGFEGGEPLRFWVALFVYLNLIFVTWRARNGLTSIIRGDDQNLTPGLERMAAWWPTISIVVILIQYAAAQLALSSGKVTFSPAVGATTVTLIVLMPFLDTMLRGFIKYLVPPMKGEGPVAEAAYYETRHSYARIGRVVLLAILILGVSRLWGISFQNIAATGIGSQFGAKILSAIIVLAVGYLVWEVTNLRINRMLAKDRPEISSAVDPDGETIIASKTRFATVLPLLRIALQFAIVTITILLALSQLGVNITPLLAGAGVFGLAIGFGAQTLVKDVVSGIFFLLDDAFRLGEFIDVGGTMGSVEKISVRSLQLRHPNGPVHIIPYGEISKLTNNSRDYVIVKLKFTVPFETDLEKVRKIFKKIGQDMLENPEHAANFIQPFKSQGVAEVNDIGIVVRGKFMTKPDAQWLIQKEIYSRVQKAFEENGIQFARKEVRVQIPGLDERRDLDDKQKQDIANSARSAAVAATD
jgi:moderate conductance mechanosensitive channel